MHPTGYSKAGHCFNGPGPVPVRKKEKKTLNVKQHGVKLYESICEVHEPLATGPLKYRTWHFKISYRE